MGVEGETVLLTRYCFSLIRLGTYALRLCLVCVVDVRVRPRSSVGILEEALDLTADLCTALFLHTRPYQMVSEATKALCGNQDPPSQDPRDHMEQAVRHNSSHIVTSKQAVSQREW